ncbi:unnamed protein product [Colias eurytheme]|nr:unnamed protein product [Colias eurytheme]
MSSGSNPHEGSHPYKSLDHTRRIVSSAVDPPRPAPAADSRAFEVALLERDGSITLVVDAPSGLVEGTASRIARPTLPLAVPAFHLYGVRRGNITSSAFHAFIVRHGNVASATLHAFDVRHDNVASAALHVFIVKHGNVAKAAHHKFFVRRGNIWPF